MTQEIITSGIIREENAKAIAPPCCKQTEDDRSWQDLEPANEWRREQGPPKHECEQRGENGAESKPDSELESI